MKIYHPLAAALIAMTLGMNVCHAGKMTDSVKFNCNQKRSYNKLLSSLSKGDTQALRYFIQCQCNYDGGDLEDLYRASGNFILTKPDLYLSLLEKESVSDRQLENFLLMLSLDTVDDIDQQKAQITKRLERVKAAKSSEIKNRAIKILEKDLASLSSIPSLR